MLPQVRDGDWIGGLEGRWWVLHTRARNEKWVARSLERQHVQYYLPLATVVRTYSKCRLRVELPLFPGYLFLCGGDDDRDTAWQTKRVAQILQVDDQDQLRSELRQICLALDSGERVDLLRSLRAGIRCRIIGGTLRGLEGVVVRRGRHCRMFLSVTMLGQSAVVEVDGALLEPID